MTQKKKILFICGSMNITTQMHQIAQALPEYTRHFTWRDSSRCLTS